MFETVPKSAFHQNLLQHLSEKVEIIERIKSDILIW